MAALISETGLVKFFSLPDFCCVEIVGKDAPKVINNLSTNDIVKLPCHGACETFVTNIRGWVVAHALAIKCDESMLLVGQHPSPIDICNHIDRYIIREDAGVRDVSDQWCALALSSEAAGLDWSHETDFAELPSPTSSPQNTTIYRHAAGMFFQLSLRAFGCGTLLLFQKGVASAVRQALERQGYSEGTSELLEWLRIRGGWPRVGREILDKTLPQELDRDSQSISFTKGCYLGQETIARLDARGQLQKKMSILRTDSPTLPELGASLVVGEKEVGTITSVAGDGGETNALSYLRRGFFDEGMKCRCGASEFEVVAPKTIL